VLSAASKQLLLPEAEIILVSDYYMVQYNGSNKNIVEDLINFIPIDLNFSQIPFSIKPVDNNFIYKKRNYQTLVFQFKIFKHIIKVKVS